jgi:hypothetical protein
MAANATPGNGTAQAALTYDTRKAKCAELLAAKVAQGYEVESEGDTEAVIVTRGRRRRLWSHIVGKRQHIAIDELGARTTRAIDENGAR